jgi:hypothetical protein
MAKPARYDVFDFTPPKGVAAAAERGSRLRQLHGRGGTPIGVARARDLSAPRALIASCKTRPSQMHLADVFPTSFPDPVGW